MRNLKVFFVLVLASVLFSCSNDDVTLNSEPNLIVRFKFDPNQVRLNNIGQPSTIPSENAAQTPVFNSISAHYFELAPTAYTQLGDGTVLYHAPETDAGGNIAIDFDQAIVVDEGEAFLKIPLSQVAQGSYEYVRVSLSYQNFGVSILNNGIDYDATVVSFVGFNTYLTTHYIGNNAFPVNGNRLQGYWAFALNDYPYATSGQSSGTTTVPNPISGTSPIPAGSCVVTGKFVNNLVINGTEKQDVEIELSLSINNSFEWNEVNFDGKYEPAVGENVVDMGLRGLIPSFRKN
jgi:hypothetical protein